VMADDAQVDPSDEKIRAVQSGDASGPADSDFAFVFFDFEPYRDYVGLVEHHIHG
jgi:hypothetical protein